MMKCFYNNNNNNNTDKTIYQQFSLLRSKGLLQTPTEQIAFISEKLIYSGLEDVITIDRKWNEYNKGIECYNIETYLDFIIALIRTHNNNNDAFDGFITFSEI